METAFKADKTNNSILKEQKQQLTKDIIQAEQQLNTWKHLEENIRKEIPFNSLTRFLSQQINNTIAMIQITKSTWTYQLSNQA